MRRALVAAGITIALAACGAAVRAADSSRPAPSRAVLVLTQTLGYHHASIPWAVQALKRVAAADGRYRLEFLSTAAALTPSALEHAVAVVLLLTTGDLPLTSTEKLAVIAFVRNGGGLVGFHSATDTFHHWPGYIAMVGGEFAYHHLPSTQRVIVEDRGNPATSSLGGSFLIHEEFYVFKHDPRRQVHVLARLATGRGGPDRPLVWCGRFGRGRVFYDALGHFIQTWSDRRQLAMVSGGMAWATGLVPAAGC